MADRLVIRSIGGPEARALARKIRGRAPNLSCFVCGHRDFGLLDEPDGGVRTLLVRESVDGRFPPLRNYQSLATLLCTTCGYVHPFAEAILDGAPPAEYGEEVADG